MDAVPFVVFDGDGRIVRTGQCQRMAIPRMRELGENVLELEGNAETHFVNTETQLMHEREPNPTTIEGTMLSNIPSGSLVRVTDETGLTDEVNPNFATLEIMVDTPGTYTVEVFSPPRWLTGTLEMVIT
jgi:hypothetical protein